MFYGRLLRSPAAAEVRQMLHRIKLDNMERARAINNGVATLESHGSGSSSHVATLMEEDGGRMGYFGGSKLWDLGWSRRNDANKVAQKMET